MIVCGHRTVQYSDAASIAPSSCELHSRVMKHHEISSLASGRQGRANVMLDLRYAPYARFVHGHRGCPHAQLKQQVILVTILVLCT